MIHKILFLKGLSLLVFRMSLELTAFFNRNDVLFSSFF